MTTEINMSSHLMPKNREIPYGGVELMIVSPPRSGSLFLQVNIRNRFREQGGSEWEMSKLYASRFVDQLSPNIDTITIVRKPSDWIASLVAQRASLEVRDDLSVIVAEEIVAAEEALALYKNFNSQKHIFINFEDATQKFEKTAAVISETFGIPLPEVSRPRVVVPRADNILYRNSYTELPIHKDIKAEITKHDLSAVNALYQDLLELCVEIV
jgi:hypothetical protein